MLRLSWLVAAALLATACPATAKWRTLDVPNDKGWQHARTGLILMAKLGDFQRTKLADNSASEFDIAATYQNVDRSATADVYLYRPGVADLPMWFDRSQYAMGTNEHVKLGAPFGSITRFALPGSTVESGLRVIYQRSDKPSGATGLAMAPLGDWLVAVRLTTDLADAPKLEAMLADLMTKIRWPADRAVAKSAILVEACTSSLKYKHAKVIKPDLTQALLGAALSSTKSDVAKDTKPAPPPVYCRESVQTADYAIYRSDNDVHSYVMAIGDAGVAAEVSPAITLTGGTAYSVVLETAASSDSYPNLTACPNRNRYSPF